MSPSAEHELPTVVTADDHPATRLGVRMALTRGGFRVVAEAADCEGAVAAVVGELPDVCLLDVHMPGGGIEAAHRIRESGVRTAVVMLSASEDTRDVLAALRAGAVGYLPKDTRPDCIPTALCGVLGGEAALPRALVGLVLQSLRDGELPAAAPVRVAGVALSARESEVLRMLRSGSKTADISEALSVSPVTVRRHISAVVAKLGVRDREAAIHAFESSAAA
ncbi:MAG TPA: response regulator transcription factor [Solirubrobacteraceae bacterium]|nr:response regulator transcription factor [Solirubrobacteraceae bacterium]